MLVALALPFPFSSVLRALPALLLARGDQLSFTQDDEYTIGVLKSCYHEFLRIPKKRGMNTMVTRLELQSG